LLVRPITKERFERWFVFVNRQETQMVDAYFFQFFLKDRTYSDAWTVPLRLLDLRMGRSSFVLGGKMISNMKVDSAQFS
jgi:hypothetical protein